MDAVATLLLMAKLSLIGIWVETVLYGINCVLYGLCMSILLRGKIASLRWVLIVTVTVLFLLGTVHVGISLQQLLDTFVYAPAGPDHTTTCCLEFAIPLYKSKHIVYFALVLVQIFVLTWRLYVVYMYDWRIIVLPIILMFAGMGCVCTFLVVFSLGDGSFNGSLKPALMFIAPAWVFGIVHNLFATAAIVARLWWMDRTMASLTGTPASQFSRSIYIAIESSVITAAHSIAEFVLFVLLSPALFPVLDVVSQLCVLAPLLIVVQVGKTASKTIISTPIRGVDMLPASCP